MSSSGLVVRGVIKNQAGMPIENGRVWISDGPVACPDVAILSDSRGEFIISAPTTGKYQIECAADGFETERHVIEVSDREAIPVEFRMKKTGS